MAEITPENPLGMKPIKDSFALGYAEKLKNDIFKMDWIFDKTYEKLILVAMLVWSVYNIWRLF